MNKQLSYDELLFLNKKLKERVRELELLLENITIELELSVGRIENVKKNKIKEVWTLD